MRVLKQIRKPSVPLHELPALVKSMLAGSGKHSIRTLSVSCAGAGDRFIRQKLRNQMRRLAPCVQVIPDTEAAHWGAFRGGQGILLICGTGSIAYGVDGCPHHARAGGWGPWIGDEGSGFWMGKELLRAALCSRPDIQRQARGILHPHNPFRLVRKIQTSRQPFRIMASFAPKILKAARRKNKLALAIVKKAQEHLLDITKQAAESLHWKKNIPFSWSGGIFQNPFFLSEFLKRLKRRIPPAKPHPPMYPPAIGTVFRTLHRRPTHFPRAGGTVGLRPRTLSRQKCARVTVE